MTLMIVGQSPLATSTLKLAIAFPFTHWTLLNEIVPEQAETGLAGKAFMASEAMIKAMPNMYEILANHPERNNFEIFMSGILENKLTITYLLQLIL